MTRVLVTLIALAALVPASASAATPRTYEDYRYGLDAYMDCIAVANQNPHVVNRVYLHAACANTLAMDWTDGGQVRRLPLCLKNRTVEFATGENHDPIRTEINCIEQYIGTNITIALPKPPKIPPAR